MTDQPPASEPEPHTSTSQKSPAQVPSVSLVGAGPGNSGFLTLRAVECLSQANLVIYDKLVPETLLVYCAPNATKVCVAELANNHVDRYRPVMELMIRAAKEGQRVVRLKGGDPFIFGRGGEEVLALRAEGISYEIVPGVTAAVGVSACAGIPMTHRDHSSAVVFVTGHENPDKPETAVDWPLLAKFTGTIAVYMGWSRFVYISQTLIKHGKDPQTPCVVIHFGTTGYQQTVEGTLEELAEKGRLAGMTSPALVIIGTVVQFRSQLSWFEHRPLFGQRILLTRPRRQSEELAHKMELLGAIPTIMPVIKIHELEDFSEVDTVINQLADFDWLVFTSSNGVRSFFRRLLAIGKDLRILGSVKLAAIGPKTADVLKHYHLCADVVPETYRSETLAESLKPLVTGKKVLLARADRGRDVLPKELSEVADVRQLTVYSQTDSLDQTSPILDNFRRGEIDYVTLTSPNIASAFLSGLDDTSLSRIQSGRTKLVSISPVTSETVKRFQLPIAAEATEYTTDGMITALIEFQQSQQES